MDHVPIALVDMDDTLCKHAEALTRDLAAIASPQETVNFGRHDDDAPAWYKLRKKIIRSQPGWWLNLEPIQRGFDLLDMLKHLEFEVHILTKGPWSCDNAWTEKVQWCKKHISPDVLPTLTREKSLVYGAVLIDDYPEYVLSWLAHRPRAQVIMPATPWNEQVDHPQVYRYEGDSQEENRHVFQLLKAARDRIVAKNRRD